jgi:hypothetical protein
MSRHTPIPSRAIPTDMNRDRITIRRDEWMELRRMNSRTPRVTRVAACMRADTGVGPSIAKGNHMKVVGEQT